MGYRLFDRLRRSFLVLFFGALLMTGASAQTPIADPGDLPALYAAAMAAGDAQAMADFYADTAIVMTPEGPVAAGREQIAQLFGQMMGGPAVSMTFNQAQLDGGGDQAVMIWDWTLNVAVPDQPVTRHIRTMLYLKRGEGGWLVHADMYQILPN